MKRTLILLFFVTATILVACKKDPAEPPTLTPTANIIFNGNFSTTSGIYSSFATTTGATKGTGTVSIAITYTGDVKTLKFTTPTGTTTNDLGTVTVSGGAYTFSKLVKDLRGAADAPLPTSGTTGSVVLTVIATLGDASTVKRFYTINIAN